MPLIAGFLLLFLLLWGLRGFTRVPPALLAKVVRRFGGVVAIGIGLFLIVRGGVEAGMAVLGFGLWFMGFFNLKGPIGFRSVGRGRRSSGISRVRSGSLSGIVTQERSRRSSSGVTTASAASAICS